MTADAAPNETPQPPPAPTEQPNGVFVTREITPDGKVAVDVSHLGDVKITEVQTILELGIKRFREIALGQKPS